MSQLPIIIDLPTEHYKVAANFLNCLCVSFLSLYIVISLCTAFTWNLPIMTAPLRSKRGCWTCRLRKKKCDEGRPHCTTCESLSITCYGYGAKPDWMDNGEKERAISISIKEIVKHTSRRKATAQAAKHGVPVTRIAPKPVISVNEDVPTNFESSSQHVTPSSYVESLRTAYVAQQSENLTVSPRVLFPDYSNRC